MPTPAATVIIYETGDSKNGYRNAPGRCAAQLIPVSPQVTYHDIEVVCLCFGFIGLKVRIRSARAVQRLGLGF